MNTLRRVALLAVPLVASVVVPAGARAATAGAVHPGVQTDTEGNQCTANFIFKDGTRTFIGQAAHCSGTDGNTATNGCEAHSMPLGTRVTVGGASKPGVMVYNSWLAMQRLGETDPNACQYNDLALVELDSADAANVDPSIPHWGGPTGLNTTGTNPGDAVYSYGNSSLRFGLTVLSPKVGTSQGDIGGGWSHEVSTITPGIPGDSGSAFLDKDGKALGVLSTLMVGIPGVVSNGVSDLNRMLQYLRARETSFAGVVLVPGTAAFQPSRLPLGI